MRANIGAIRILKTLEDEAREPSQDEKQSLVRYTGWGAFAQAIFDKDQNSAAALAWAAERAELQDLLTAGEWESARASTVNAHFTCGSRHRRHLDGCRASRFRWRTRARTGGRRWAFHGAHSRRA